MSTLPLHPAIVHLPLGLALVIPLVALGLAFWHLRRGGLPRAAFAILLGLQALLVASGIVAMQLGERDERRVESIVAERVVEAHEERAEVFLWAAGLVLAAAGALLVAPARIARGLSVAVAVATIGVAALAVRTGEAGGEIVYTHGGARAFAPAQERATAGIAPASERALPGWELAPAPHSAGRGDDD